ncbi:MerR family transcriptional regulator [Thalassovita sp.]|uniref:MerR family transcriptional regulator n=1 Tax=Thalassovita sp. TaxID=1979401 RepID=UPI002AB31AB7|nr:MerR family transcriptional regulator [Thalassovita sp.]
MLAKEAASHLGISQRMLRHYETSGLMEVPRHTNGYRLYRPADLRRAERIRDFIAAGFSTREVYAMRDCLSDQGTGPCEGGIKKMQEKLDHIDRLQSDLSKRRATILLRIKDMEAGLADAKAPTPEMVD